MVRKLNENSINPNRRTITVVDDLGNREEYKKIDEYDANGIHFIIYKGECYREWAIFDSSLNKIIIIASYNNISKDKLYDYIDDKAEYGRYYWTVFEEPDRYYVHPNGNTVL